MTGPSKVKGDRAEREAIALLNDLIGCGRRKLGAGRKDDEGDIDSVPDTVIQVADWANVARAVREKPVECEVQQARAGALFGVSMIRLRGGVWRFVSSPAQWTTLWREAQPMPPMVHEQDVRAAESWVDAQRGRMR